MDRLKVLQRHLSGAGATNDAALEVASCSSVKVLPRFDISVMENFLDDMCDFKAKVYEEFRQSPELLPPVIEGLTKGTCPAASMAGAEK